MVLREVFFPLRFLIRGCRAAVVACTQPEVPGAVSARVHQDPRTFTLVPDILDECAERRKVQAREGYIGAGTRTHLSP